MIPEIYQNITPGTLCIFSNEELNSSKQKEIVDYLKDNCGSYYNIDLLKCEFKQVVGLYSSIIAARRINIGCINKYAVISCPFSIENHFMIKSFFDTYYDISSFDDTEYLNMMMDSNTILSPCCSEKLYSAKVSEDKCCMLDSSFLCNYSEIKEDDDNEDEEETLEQNSTEIKELLDKISPIILDYILKTHKTFPINELEKLISGKLLLNNNGILSITINNNGDIFLPSINEIKVKMICSLKVLYFLFLKHPEGVKLKDIDNYKRELIDIYTLVAPQKDAEQKTLQIIENPELIHQKISRIRRLFESIIVNKPLAQNYSISGSRGELYKINIPKENIILPKWLKNNI